MALAVSLAELEKELATADKERAELADGGVWRARVAGARAAADSDAARATAAEKTLAAEMRSHERRRRCAASALALIRGQLKGAENQLREGELRAAGADTLRSHLAEAEASVTRLESEARHSERVSNEEQNALAAELRQISAEGALLAAALATSAAECKSLQAHSQDLAAELQQAKTEAAAAELARQSAITRTANSHAESIESLLALRTELADAASALQTSRKEAGRDLDVFKAVFKEEQDVGWRVGLATLAGELRVLEKAGAAYMEQVPWLYEEVGTARHTLSDAADQLAAAAARADALELTTQRALAGRDTAEAIANMNAALVRQAEKRAEKRAMAAEAQLSAMAVRSEQHATEAIAAAAAAAAAKTAVADLIHADALASAEQRAASAEARALAVENESAAAATTAATVTTAATAAAAARATSTTDTAAAAAATNSATVATAALRSEAGSAALRSELTAGLVAGSEAAVTTALRLELAVVVKEVDRTRVEMGAVRTAAAEALDEAQNARADSMSVRSAASEILEAATAARAEAREATLREGDARRALRRCADELRSLQATHAQLEGRLFEEVSARAADARAARHVTTADSAASSGVVISASELAAARAELRRALDETGRAQEDRAAAQVRARELSAEVDGYRDRLQRALRDGVTAAPTAAKNERGTDVDTRALALGRVADEAASRERGREREQERERERGSEPAGMDLLRSHVARVTGAEHLLLRTPSAEIRNTPPTAGGGWGQSGAELGGGTAGLLSTPAPPYMPTGGDAGMYGGAPPPTLSRLSGGGSGAGSSSARVALPVSHRRLGASQPAPPTASAYGVACPSAAGLGIGALPLTPPSSGRAAAAGGPYTPSALGSPGLSPFVAGLFGTAPRAADYTAY